MKKALLSTKGVLSFLAVTMLIVSFQNCSRVAFDASSLDMSSNGQLNDCAINPSACAGGGVNPSAGPTCEFNGKKYSEGQTVTAYLHSAVASGQTCVSEIRKCSNGVLSGSYSYASCAVNAPSACLFNGQTVAHGQSVDAYQNSSVAYGASCAKEVRTCNNGVLSGSYSFASCSPGAAAACLFNGQTVAHGAVVKAFQASTVGFGQSCVSEDRVCNNGTLSGSYGFANCTVGTAASCLFNGQNIAHSATVVAYASSTVGYGQTCASQTRTCNNGILSGSFGFASCSPGAPASCSFNGQSIAHGQSVTGFLSSTVSYGSSCSSETRTCNNGTLTGSYNYSSCSVSTASACYFNGQTVPHGGSVYAYASSSVPYGYSCSGEYRTCNNGSLSGSYGTSSCTVQTPSCPSSFYPGVLCEVRAYCPSGNQVATITTDVTALTVSGYKYLSGNPGDYAQIYSYNVDFRLSDMSLIYINHRVQCRSNGTWVDAGTSASSCIARKNLPSYDSRCR